MTCVPNKHIGGACPACGATLDDNAHIAEPLAIHCASCCPWRREWKGDGRAVAGEQAGLFGEGR